MTTTNSASLNVQSSASESCLFTPPPQCISTTLTGSQGYVRSTDTSASESDPPRVSRPRLSRGSCHTPDPCRSQLASSSSSSSESLSSTAVFVDHDSGVVVSGLFTASGEHITTHEFQRKPHRVLAPTLCIVIPSNSSSSSLPGFALTLPSPISPTQLSPVLPPPTPFTLTSYLAAAAGASPNSPVPSLPPQHCPHTSFRLPLTTAAPPQSRYCALCSLQEQACEIWLGSRGPMLCAPQLPAAANTSTTRAIYHALELPLGCLESSCIDSDVDAAIIFKRQAPRLRTGNSGGIKIKSKPVSVDTRAPAASRIVRGVRRVVRRARHVLSAPTRVLPMIPIPIIPRRRVNLRP